LYRVAELRAIEHAAAAALPDGELMRRAGQAGAEAALALFAGAARPATVLVVAGPGNNGGDALEVAANLAGPDPGAGAAGVHVIVLHYPPPGVQSAERGAAYERAVASPAQIIDGDARLQWSDIDLVVDGLFGIGLTRPISGTTAALIGQVNMLDCPVLALDVPSGLDADTGAVVGPDGVAIRASHTITFIGDKPGLHTNDGRDHAGAIAVAPLAIDAALYPAVQLQLNHPILFAGQLKARRQNTHKGSYGNVAVVGGAPGMSGAPILAARTALHGGAGRVYVLFPEQGWAADSGQPELMCRPADGFDMDQATVVIGPGLGSATTATDLLAHAIASTGALLADADALNLLAATPALQTGLAARPEQAVLTPHPLEAARLLGVMVAAVQADRVTAARTLATRLNAVVVLKGSGTVIAAPDGRCVINTTGNAALATAGTGDVLSGLCGSLLAQGWPQWQAALAAVWLHGTAADDLVAAGVGPIGLTAGELIPAIRTALNRMVRAQAAARAVHPAAG
jgi:hydroxyethylthiazole kinase-like uncharacterized protein yjeF